MHPRITAAIAAGSIVYLFSAVVRQQKILTKVKRERDANINAALIILDAHKDLCQQMAYLTDIAIKNGIEFDEFDRIALPSLDFKEKEA